MVTRTLILVRITSISPIGGILGGGIDVTLTGVGFQPGAEVFFGTVASPEVNVESSHQATAKVPPAAQTGTVPVSLVNPDGSTAELTSGFTYVSSAQGNHAEVHGVEPINVIEDTDTQIQIRGRNLIAAHESGLVALRGPARANIAVSDFASSHDDATGIESLTCTVRVTATPALAEKERMAIQVLASLRPAAQSDGVVESSREMLVVLPKTIPVPVAYTSSLSPDRPNLVVVTGRNLAGCSLDLGANATIHMQSSDDEVVSALVTYPSNQAAPQLSIRSDAGGEVARFEMAVEPMAVSREASLPVPGDGGDPPGDGPTLIPVPGQQVTGPTAESSAVVNLNGQSLFSFNFDWSSFVVQFFHIRFRVRIANFMRVVPFFDGGGEEVDTPVVAKVGQLMNLRGMGILIALRVEITITISVSVILGYRFGFGFNPYNEFPQFGFGLGSIVIGFRFDFDIDIEIFFMTALILPDGSLKVLALVDFDIDFHFQLSTDLRTLKFNHFTHKVNLRRIGPFANNLTPCDGRFQLAEENGQTVFPDAFGGHQAFYFVRAPGRCCLSWSFDFDLIRFTDGGPETVFQPPFNVDYCLNALDSANQSRVRVVSDQLPEGFPPAEELNVADTDNLRAMFEMVNPEDGTLELRDVRDFGYQVEFYLAIPPEVCDAQALRQGLAFARESGDNVIFPKLFRATVVITDPGIEVPSFLPGGVLGFEILSFLARGFLPAILTDRGLPVTVNALAAPGTITVSLTLAYYDQDELNEVTKLTLERNEPFEAQREYVLAARVTVNDVQLPQTLKVTSKNPRVGFALAGLGFLNPRGGAHAAKDFFEGEMANDSSSGSSLTFTVTNNMLGKLVPIGPQDRNGARLKITPHNKEEGNGKFVPPGKAVSGHDTTVTIDFEAQPASGSTATAHLTKPSLTLIVSNDETFEEYLRVFEEVAEILGSSVLQNFEVSFDAHLHDQGRDLAKIKTYVQKKGEDLWQAAVEEVQTHAHRKDDRPLYWIRLRCIAALRAYFKRQQLLKIEDMIPQFEWPSRGLDTSGAIVFDAAAGPRKVVVTGFDPFALPSVPDQSNPSGLIALELDKGSVGASQPAVDIRTAVIPVRYKEFDDGLIENLLRVSLGTLSMFVTCSENGGLNYYDLERWASRNRLLTFEDNNNKKPNQIPGVVPAAEEFEESTLPYDAVITTARTLSGPQGNVPFVMDQSYLVAGVSGNRTRNRTDHPPADEREETRPGEFRPEPDEQDEARFTKVADAPDPEHKSPSRKSNQGSGGSYLSNEIFYRTARQRRRERPAVPSGHFHLPGTGTVPTTTGPALITGVRTALGDLVDAIARLRPRITSFHPRSVRPGGFVTIVGENLAGAIAVRVGTDDVSNFTTLSSTQIQFDVTDELSSGFISVDTGYGTALSATMLIVIRRPGHDDFGPLLIARRAELGLSAREAATQVGARLGAYRRWERGQDRPSARFQPAITSFLGRDPTPDPVAFGESIRAARERDGLTRSQLAGRLGLASSTVRAWETGTVRRPSPRVGEIFQEYLEE